MSLFSENGDHDITRYESDDEQQNSERLAKIKEAQAEENVRLKALNLRKKMTKRLGSPLGSSRKVQSPADVAGPSAAKKSKSAQAKKGQDARPVMGSASGDDLVTNSFLQHSSFEDEDDVDDDKTGGMDLSVKPVKPDSTVKPKQPYTIPRKDRTSAILPERFWPSDMSAAQVDKLTVDQVHSLKKLELEEKSLKKDEDLPGLVIAPTQLYLPEVTVPGGDHDYIKKIVPGSMLHFPIGPPEDWWEHVAVEWKTVTGKTMIPVSFYF